MSTRTPDPREALEAIQSARRTVQPSTRYSPLYDVLYGGACALLIGSQGLDPPLSIALLAVAMAALAGAVQWFRKTYGWWVSGFSPRRARWVAVALALLLGALMGVTIYGREVGPHWLWMVAAPVAFVAAIGGSRLWLHVWSRELEEQA